MSEVTEQPKIVAGSLAILAAACGGEQPDGTPASTATAPATQAPTSAVGAPATGSLAFAAGMAEQTVSVGIIDTAYESKATLTFLMKLLAGT